MQPTEQFSGNNLMVKQNVTKSPILEKLYNKVKDHLTFVLVFFLLINVVMIGIGAANLNNCPVEENIPIYLVTAGVLGLIPKIIKLIKWFYKRFILMETIACMVFTFEFAYFMMGCFYVYKAYEPSYDPADDEKYCDKTTYLFAFSYLTVLLVILIILLLCLGCLWAGIVVAEKLSSDHKTEKGAVIV